MRPIALVFCLLGVAVAPPQAAKSEPPQFARKPTAAKIADGVMVRFAVDRETDVAV